MKRAFDQENLGAERGAARLPVMRPLSTMARLIIAGVLALLLIVYVFGGGSSTKADAGPHCTSQQALDQVKGELFRRAAGVRGTSDPGFDAVARYSVVRAGSRLVRRHYPRSDKVTCTGSIALDLPPGAAVVGGRRTLAANLAYDIAPGPKGSVRLLSLDQADAIVVPLASVSNSSSEQGEMPLQAPQANGTVGEMPPSAPQSMAPPPPPGPPAAEHRAARPAPPPPPPRTPEPPRKAAPAKPTAAPKAATPPSHPKPPTAPPPPPVATASPSFNCRYAHTRGEIAVCGDPGLAALDREMSAEYYRAVSAARPGQRVILERSRTRFLRYRDSCGSEACIADAYRGRMREIAGIMTGGW